MPYELNFLLLYNLQYNLPYTNNIYFYGYSLCYRFLKDLLVMHDKRGENQKLLSTSLVQLCPRCTFCFEGAVKLGGSHSANTQPQTL